jgi:hypothetical protein
MKKVFPSVAASAALLLIAGCGGSSSSSSTASFVAKANAICAQSGAQITALPAAGNDAASQAASLQQQLPIAQSEETALKALTPPSSIDTNWNKALGINGQLDTYVAQLIAAFQAGNDTEVSAIVAKVKPLTSESTQLASTLKLTACAANYTPSGSTSADQTGTSTT